MNRMVKAIERSHTRLSGYLQVLNRDMINTHSSGIVGITFKCCESLYHTLKVLALLLWLDCHW